MSKFWKVTSPPNELAYYASAPNKETAVKLVEGMTGPMNPNSVVLKELTELPPGYMLSGPIPCLLDEDPDYEG